MTTEEEMEGPISFWGYKEQESNLILPGHDDDDDKVNTNLSEIYSYIIRKKVWAWFTNMIYWIDRG